MRLCICTSLLTLLGLVHAQVWGLQMALGLTLNPPVDLLVVQQGHPEAWVKGARFEGRDLEPFPYYTLRLWYGEPVGWRLELELIHQKLYFVEAEAGGEILQQLHVTDGFNYLPLNLAYGLDTGALRLWPRLGLGAVVPHPETVVRGQAWGVDGDPLYYHLGGVGGQVALGVGWPGWAGAFVEGKLTLGLSRLQIAEGYIWGHFRTLHLNLGFGP
ncbi:hypothetical protein DV704_00385 [Meiothermus sp. QL-1]|uniref:hypothetical protein n=1 Tax=Meiothermus sp. QL-1 TaxID=2058095 RepID=UPI000E0A6F34|nr:hypothetical protein [Meiothermus sp. QL-1]RDI96320.1 hypothetical protein DV704_00385 [Meiothermus sp. QL-1]